MSKRPDESDVPEIEEGTTTTAERRRRRRRGGGLRVPSDNVPRRAQPVAPVPEDPALAVSIAYSFGSDGSQPVPTVGSDETAEGTDVRRGVPRTAAAMAAAAATPEQLEEISEADFGKTKEMPAVQLEALGLEVPEFLEEKKTEGTGETFVVDVDEMKVEEGAGAEPPRGDNGRRPVTNRASTVALSDDDLEEVLEPAMPRRAPSPREPAASTTPSQLAAFDEHSGVGLPSVRFKTADWDEEPEPARPRDTEERAATDPEADGAEDVDVEARAGSQPGDDGSEDIALDDGDLQDELVEPADPSDSGEILSDELIEEVEAQAAQPVPIKRPPDEEPAVAEPAPAREAPAAEAQGKPVDKPAAGNGAAAAAAAAAAPAAAKPPVAPSKPPPAPPKKPNAARVAAVAAAAAAPQSADTRDERRRRAKPWFEEIFDEDYLRTLPFLTPQATQAEAQFVVEALGLQAGSQVLDLGCGYGRHAMELAARGFHVVGLDLSLPLLLRGADEAQRRGLTINFVHGDMRELDFDSQFDGAYCVFSTFGYFDDETNKKTASNLARALKPGARVVLDILNRDYLIADLPTRVWWEGDGCVVLEEVEFNYFSSRIQCNRSVVFDDGRQVEQEISLRAYSLHEVGKLLHAAGFRVLEISGSMATRGRFFGGASRHIIVVAERRPKEPAKDASGSAPKDDVSRS